MLSHEAEGKNFRHARALLLMEWSFKFAGSWVTLDVFASWFWLFHVTYEGFWRVDGPYFRAISSRNLILLSLLYRRVLLLFWH